MSDPRQNVSVPPGFTLESCGRRLPTVDYSSGQLECYRLSGQNLRELDAGRLGATPNAGAAPLASDVRLLSGVLATVVDAVVLLVLRLGSEFRFHFAHGALLGRVGIAQQRLVICRFILYTFTNKSQ